MPLRRNALTLIRLSLHTPELILIWAVEAINYAVHNTSWRPVPWNSTSRAACYALWAVQLWCFAKLQLSDPGSVPAGWEQLAREGHEPATVCPRSGRLVPPRAGYSRNAGKVILGLDHYCYWLGTPVGFGNRKLFLLFVGYSALFCAVGAAHSAYEFTCGAPMRGGLPTLAGAFLSRERPPPIPLEVALAGAQTRLERAVATLAWFWAPLLAMLRSIYEWAQLLFLAAAASDPPAPNTAPQPLLFLAAAASDEGRGVTLVGSMGYLWAVLFTIPLNALAALLLGGMTLHQLVLVLFNRTTLAPNDARYDVGFGSNWRVVFGSNPWLWPLPLLDVERAGVDGVHWEESARWARRQQRSESIRKAHLEAQHPAVYTATTSGKVLAVNSRGVHSNGDMTGPRLRQRKAVGANASGADRTHADGSLAAAADEQDDGDEARWALDRHHHRMPVSLTHTYTVLQALRAAAVEWERRLFCGMMSVGWLRIVLRSLSMASQARRARRGGIEATGRDRPVQLVSY